MPGREGTGSMGMGQMTGRGYGFCGNRFYGRKNCYVRGFRGRGFEYGARYGFGPGYGMRYGRLGYARQDLTEKEFLENQKELLKSQINIIDKELDKNNDEQ